VSHPLRARVWTAGRLIVLVGALGLTFGVFFLTAMRVAIHAREVRVPDIHGLSVADATAALANVGLVLKVDARRADPKVPADHIVSQDPAANTVLRRDRSVGVRVSEGQRDPVVPDLVGQPERTADIVLAQDQIQIANRAEIGTARYPAGVVIAQDPVSQARSAHVSLLVNRGEGGTTFVMPDVIGTLGLRTVDILRRRGLRVTVTAEVPYPGLPPGVIVRQTPQAGFQIGYGDPVQLEISR
jgi:serine/threonine-protein kinase